VSRAPLSTNGILGASGALYAAVLALIVLVPSFPAALATFSVPSWEEHMRQHHGGRLTRTDREVEEAALAFSDPPPRAEHLLPP
jgi:hypothetical protein